jgi:glutathione S-transferase
MMRLYYDPSSTTCRPIILFAAEAGIELDPIHVNLMAGEHQAPWFAALNPSRAVPVLQHGDFVLTESSAILKYLAEAHGAAAYPKDPKQRARVNERMDWFATFFLHDVGYGLCYADILPSYRMSEATQGELAASSVRAPRRASTCWTPGWRRRPMSAARRSRWRTISAPASRP